MGQLERGPRRSLLFLIMGLFLVSGLSVFIFLLKPAIEPWVKTLTTESRRILGLERKGPTPEERRIREEVILKKMEEVSLQIDWRSSTPDYPRRRDLGSFPEKERMKALKETPEFKEMDQEVKEYARKKEELFKVDPPLPSTKDATDYTHLKDKGTERVIQRLLNSKEKIAQEKPLEENLRLGIKGPAASRKIIERSSPPQIKVRVETEIELTFYVLPDGRVDRVIPSVKGDAELERVAVQYLKQWRFAPLANDQSQVEQWGSLPIKFKIQ